MPGKIKVKVLAGRNLPVMDRASDTTDAFVEIKFGSVTHKTDVCRKSLNPHWNSTEWYRFEVDESELQDEPLQLRLMDHDTYSANDAIGKVVISLAPLLAREANNAKNTAAPHGGAVMSGWIPVFDTMHGIRGELNVIVKVELFSDFNKYKTSSCGVQFFHCPVIPPGYRATAIHGFVEELVVNDDPEYQWIDKIRTPRASNEARQVAFIKLSNQVQRLIGLKAAELGANAVVGYQQDFDLEGEAGVVARAIGTAVSITPLPMPSHPLNKPPCTQQQLKKYLDILATDNESITEMSQYYQNHQEELQKLLSILNPNASALLDEADTFDDYDKSMDIQTRQSSITSYAGSVFSIYQDDYPHTRSLRHLSEDQTDLNRLLNKDSDDSDSSGTLQKIRKIKTNFFTKRFSRRSKKATEKQDDSVSIKSNASDTSRISLVDIKNELKKLKRLKKPKFRKPFVNKEDEGEGMASILARSIIHVHTSLDCIAETQDSEASPGSTLRRTSESEPTIAKADDDPTKINTENDSKKEEDKKAPEIRFTSLNNISSEDPIPKRERKLSESCPATPMPERTENLLTLPGEKSYYGSISSALSAESSEIESSSDEEDDESSDMKTDNERSIETTSSVVQSVLKQNLSNTFVPTLDKLSSPESGSPESEVKQEVDKKLEVEQQIFDNKVLVDKCKSLESVPQTAEVKAKPVRSNEASTSSVKDDTCVTKHSHHIKFHNPFVHKKTSKSISEPSSPVEKSSFVHRSSKRIKRQLSKLSKSNMIKSISHYTLRPKTKESTTPLSHPGSSSDIQSKAPSDTVLGTPFMSYNDLLALDKESMDTHKFFHKSDEFDRAKVSMYIGSEPVSRASLSGPSILYPKEEIHEKKHSLKSAGLVHTAMETILLDKVQSLLIPTSPDPQTSKDKQFFDDVNEKLGKVEEYRSNIESVGNNIHIVRDQKSESMSPVDSRPVIVSGIRKAEKANQRGRSKSPSLVQTAMETILMDQVHSALIPLTPDTPMPEPIFEENPNRNEHSESKVKKPLALIKALPEKIFDIKPKKKEVKRSSLIHTAMETMLMEKVQSVLGPETPELMYTSAFDAADRPEYYEAMKKKEEKSTGLTHTALETMLMERVQASALGAGLPDPVLQEIDSSSEGSKPISRNETSSGLTHTALETMLMERAQASALGAAMPDPVLQESDSGSEKSKPISRNDTSSSGLTHMALETMLMERAQSSALGAAMPDPVLQESDSGTERSKPISRNETSSSGLTHMALETMLMERAQASALGAAMPDPVLQESDSGSEKSKPISRNDTSSSGLTHMALETMLMERAQSSALGAAMPDPVLQESDSGSEKSKPISRNDTSSSGLTHMALETMLMERAQSSALGAAMPDPVLQESDSGSEKSKPISRNDTSSSGLTHMALETMLMERAQSSALGAAMPDPVLQESDSGSEKSKPISRNETSSSGLTHTAMETMLLERTSALGVMPTDRIIQDTETNSEKSKPISRNETSSSGLTHTAMETMLLERASALGVMPTDRIIQETENQSEKSKQISRNETSSSGLTHTAMETMLLERVQASALGATIDPEIQSGETDSTPENPKDLSSSSASCGLTHTAMETILMDKVHSLVGQPDMVYVEPKHFTEKELDNTKISSKDDLKPGLIQTAVETILLDKVQATSLGTPGPIPTEEVKKANIEQEDTKSLTHTAIETMLLDSASVFGAVFPDNITPSGETPQNTEKSKKLPTNTSSGLINTAMETNLMDKVHSLVGQPGMTFVEPKTFTDEELEKAEHLGEELKSPGLVKSVAQAIGGKVNQLAVDESNEALEKSLKSSNDNLKSLNTVKSSTASLTKHVDKTKHVQKGKATVKETKPTEEVTKTIEKSKSVPEHKHKKLQRQDSVHSLSETETPNMSKKSNIVSSSDITKPALISHPLLKLDTIPSLPESNDIIDVETNNSVCVNSHAVCGANRGERDRDRREDKCEKDRGSPRHARHESYGGREPVQTTHMQNSSLNATSTPLGIHRRSSDSDLSVTPKGGSLNTSAGNVGSGGGAILRPSMNSNNLDMLEYPFLTMTEYPTGFIVHIGGTVCARSVKLADGGEGGARAAWWAELRTELRAHARALRCNAVIAYTETTAICEDVCVLSASGTAVVINLDCDFNADSEHAGSGSKNTIDELECESCSLAHVPYSPGAGPYRAELSTCGGCRRARVPTVLLATCAKPARLAAHAKAITLTAVAARVRRAPPTSEPGARDISDQLPFLEYELHKLLLAKLRMQGANALFSLQTQISIGERCVMALASGTACRLTGLPPPTPPRIKASENDKDALEIQKALWETFTANRTANGYDVGVIEHNTNGVLPETETEDAPALDLCADKDACVLELDEAEDVETARALAKRHVNMQVFSNGLKPLPGAPPQAFAQVWRSRLVISNSTSTSAGERHVRRALDGVAYKLRRLHPAALSHTKFHLELPEDEIQLVVSGTAIPLQDPNTPEVLENGNHGNGDNNDDDIFALDEEQLVKHDDSKCCNGQAVCPTAAPTNPGSVPLTTLSTVFGSRASRRVCALRLLFVRETTAVRELGGLSGFLHTFTCEVLAIVRAYTTALGGNALTSFYITQLMLQDNAHKNQGQCLLSVGGDVVHITY